MSEEFHSKYRPKSYKQVIGQDAAVAMLTSMKQIPHALLFSGPSGVGKTTLARIIRKKLDCADLDFKEINAASTRGVDTVRDIESQMRLAPMGGNCRLFLIDEAHCLTKDAQSALLKMLEDCPKRAYFILATTEPQKLLATIRTRCTAIALSAVPDSAVRAMLLKIAGKEKLELAESVLDKIIELADGSMRRAVVALGSIAGLKTEDEQLAAIEKVDEKRQAIDLCRMLMGHERKKKVDWKEIALTIKAIPDGELESFRRMVLAYATSCMIGGKDKSPPASAPMRAYKVIACFSDNWFDSGRAGLVASCCEVLFED